MRTLVLFYLVQKIVNNKFEFSALVYSSPMKLGVLKSGA